MNYTEFFNEQAPIIHANAKDKGFHDKQPSLGHQLALVVTELAEAIEANRKGRNADWVGYENDVLSFRAKLSNILAAEDKEEVPAYLVEDDVKYRNAIQEQMNSFLPETFKHFIKDSFGDELADAAIRLLDICGCFGFEVDIPDDWYSDDWKNIPEQILSIMHDVTCADCDIEEEHAFVVYNINSALCGIIKLCEKHEVDLRRHMVEKMRYNATRERLHGKTY